MKYLSLFIFLGISLQSSLAYSISCSQLFIEKISFKNTRDPAWTQLKSRTGIFRKKGELSILRFGSYNVSTFSYGNTNHGGPSRMNQIGDILHRDIDADVYALQELSGDPAALRSFSRDQLANQYKDRLNAGNDRYVHLGMLVKDDLPMNLEFRSHKSRTWSDPIKAGALRRVFTRDAQVTIYRINGFAQPLLVTINIHSKSQRDRYLKGNKRIHNDRTLENQRAAQKKAASRGRRDKGVDPFNNNAKPKKTGSSVNNPSTQGGIDRDLRSEAMRRAQHKALVRIYNNMIKEFGEDLPVIIMGDTNTNVMNAKSLEGIKRAGFVDALELMNRPQYHRVTHAYHPHNGGKTLYQQLDALFVSPSLQQYVSDSGVYHYRNTKGKVLSLPLTREEGAQLPSDHRLVWVDIDFAALIDKIINEDY